MRQQNEIPFVVEDILMKFVPIELADGTRIDGDQTAELIAEACRAHGCTWMSVSSLPRGMSRKRLKRFCQGIKEGQKIHLYIAVNHGNYHNEIAWSALIKDLVSSDKPVPCPDTSVRSEAFEEHCSRTWLKLSDMKRETHVKAEDFVIASTGADLKYTLGHSRMSFAYIMERIG